MEYRNLGLGGPRVSSIAFGAWAIGGAPWGPADDAASVAAIRRAFELGVTLFDTAPIYGHGRSEELVGKTLGDVRDQVFIATKVGPRWDRGDPMECDLSRENVLRQIDDSLRRLETDRVDLWQVHWADRRTPIDATMRAIEDVVASGKALHVGVSNFSVAQIGEARRHGRVESVQPPYNLLRREIERELLPFCRKEEIGVLVYEPLCRGLLTGKFGRGTRFPEDDIRRRDDRFAGEAYQKNLGVVDRVRAVARRVGATPAQVAIAWTLRDPAVTTALCGARSAAQVEENVGAAGVKLDDEALAELDALGG